jgi:hypothetical protein
VFVVAKKWVPLIQQVRGKHILTRTWQFGIVVLRQYKRGASWLSLSGSTL